VTVPGPGWHVDPLDPTLLRWWDGQSWTEAQRARPREESGLAGSSLTGARPYVSMEPYRRDESTSVAGPLTRKEKDRQIRRNNSFAYTGLVLALVGLLVNPFALLSVLAVVFSAIGLARAESLVGRPHVTGRGTAIAGMIVGVAGLAFFAWSWVRLVG
jgi:hypothetical protein